MASKDREIAELNSRVEELTAQGARLVTQVQDTQADMAESEDQRRIRGEEAARVKGNEEVSDSATDRSLTDLQMHVQKLEDFAAAV